MVSVSTSATTEELMAACVARELPSTGVGFVGVGSGGRAFTLTFGVPVAAASLRFYRDHSDFALILGSAVDPQLDACPAGRWPSSPVNLRYHPDWPASARLAALDHMDMICAGHLDVAFTSAAQIDAFGNTNITTIGNHDRPAARLVGCLAQPELYAFAKTVIVVTDLRKRTFVESVDFVTSVGHLHGGTSRVAAGLSPGGPHVVVTDKAIFGFAEDSRRMTVKSLHPGVSKSEVADACSFDLVWPQFLPITPRPTNRDLTILRRTIDPFGVLLKGGA